MKQFIVDAFTDRVFAGNPAAICILDQWLPDALMQSITTENNLSETAFAVKQPSGTYHLRWFTPGGEIDLCGHATLACAYVILNHIESGWDSVTFDSMSGQLVVTKKGDLYELDFPAYDLKPVPVTEQMTDAIGARPLEAWMGRDLLCLMDSEDFVRTVNPDQGKVLALDGLLLHLTAAGTDTDCVSRSFAPKCSIPEDPVCGSGHCHIVPFWLKRLKKDSLVAYQASRRGGTLYCRQEGERVYLSGKAALFAISELFIDA